MTSVGRISLRTRSRAVLERNPLPTGTLQVGLAVGVAGLSAYGFLIVAARALGPDDYAPLSVLWALSFLVGPGFFLPLEQEVARALAARRVRKDGGEPVIRRAALLGFATLGVLLVAGLLAGPALTDQLFDGEWLLLVAWLGTLAGACVAHLARGTLAGQGRFGGYARFVAAESATRFLAAVVLAVVGVSVAGPFGVAIALGPFVALTFAFRGERGLREPGSPAEWRELSTSLAWLLLGSVVSMALVNAGPLAMRLLAGAGESDEAGRFLAGLVIARVPLFLFQAVQAVMIPRLAQLAGERRIEELRRGLAQLLIGLAGLAAAATIGAGLLGPFAVRLLFGGEFELSHQTMALLAAGSGLYLVAAAAEQANIALGRQTGMALAWTVGLVALLVTIAVSSDDLFLRVELGGLVGCGLALVSQLAVLRSAARDVGKLDPDDVMEALTDLSFEP